MSEQRRGMTLKELHTRHKVISQKLAKTIYVENVQNHLGVDGKKIIIFDSPERDALLAEEREIERVGSRMVGRSLA